MSDKNVSDMSDDEIRAMAGVSTSRAAPDLDWPAARRAIDTAIARARREIAQVVADELAFLGEVANCPATGILAQVKDSLDDIDQTIPPEEDDEAE